MMNFAWNLHQAGQVAEARSDAAQAKDEVSLQKGRIQDLEFALNRMALANQALWELLRERVGITEDELLARITEVDLRDGVKDGRMTPQLASCPSCGRTVNTRNSRCIFCGAALPKPHLFQ